ncbi:MAG: efflux RND transporter permease subunit [Thermoguttaceae bacterium]|nr:efflux RND transporter permease subunit [Thermoguttaceae bacterium]
MLSNYSVHHRVFTLFLMTLLVFGGLWAFETMGRLEDPEFTIKTSLIVTAYPGASPSEVESRVTDVVERGVRRVKGVKRVRSLSRAGVSIVYVDMLDAFPHRKLPQAWVELRNKMKEIQTDLPIGTVPPMVRDDFGDVYGIVLALSADGYSDAELRDRAKELQRELSLVDQVGRVELWGEPTECVEVEVSRAKMAELSVHPSMVLLALARQNLVGDAGEVFVDQDRVRLAPNGRFQSVEEIGDLVLTDGLTANITDAAAGIVDGSPMSGTLAKLADVTVGGAESSRQIRLRDVATVRRTLTDPLSTMMRCDGKPAIALAIAPTPNGNVLKMGDGVRKRTDEILATFPVGFECDAVAYQPDNVKSSVDVFMKNLREAVIIVMIVVMLAMGMRSGLLITSSLLFVILGTMSIYDAIGGVLHRTSLAAFIIALGILVDDAVVVGDLILVRMQMGMDKTQACIEGAKRASMQLLGATIVGALAFLPVYLSPDSTGEYCGDLFLVIAISLMLSWLIAMMQTPVAYYMFVNIDPKQLVENPHGGPIYQAYRRLLAFSLYYRWRTVGIMLLLLVAAGYGFTHVEQIFFPRAQRTQYMIDYWLPEGTSIEKVAAETREIEKWLAAKVGEGEDQGVVNTATFIGGGPPRFYLPYEPELPSACYAQVIVNTHTLKDVDRLIPETERWLKEHFPQAQPRVQRFSLSMPSHFEVEARFRGPDPVVLRQLAVQAEKILEAEPTAKDVRNDWRQQTPIWVPEYSQMRGQRAGISRADMMFALRWATKGIPCAFYNEGDKQLPVIVRGTRGERNDLANLTSVPVWGSTTQSIPLGQVVSDVKQTWENPIIQRYDRLPAITVGADASGVQWTELMRRVRPKIEEIELPPGYTLEWKGQYEGSRNAESAMMSKLPIALILMALIVVGLFNAVKQPLIIVLTFPLAAIGITAGLLLLNKPFGFMALVGAMSLLGMMVRNAVVLMDQIDEEMKKGDDPYHAILDAAVERMRPVTVAALTVIVGMIPLLQDPLFDSMATVIMFGLIFATALTLLFVPVLYTFFFRIKPQKPSEAVVKTDETAKNKTIAKANQAS